jgi:RNA polymerase sigma factor (sigma-70 family)
LQKVYQNPSFLTKGAKMKHSEITAVAVEVQKNLASKHLQATLFSSLDSYIKHIIFKFAGDMDREELYQEAYIVQLKCLEKWNKDKNVAFSTYFCTSFKNHLLDLKHNNRLIRQSLEQYMKDPFCNKTKAIDKFEDCLQAYAASPEDECLSILDVERLYRAIDKLKLSPNEELCLHEYLMNADAPSLRSIAKINNVNYQKLRLANIKLMQKIKKMMEV